MTALLNAPGLAEERIAAGRRELWAMSAAERVEHLLSGEMTWDQCWEWARRRPAEVPTLNGEFLFIAAHTPEVAE